MNEPKLKLSTDSEWRAYYETKCREQRKELANLRTSVEELSSTDWIAIAVEGIRSRWLEWETDAEQLSTSAQDSRAGEEHLNYVITEYLTYVFQNREEPSE